MSKIITAIGIKRKNDKNFKILSESGMSNQNEVFGSCQRAYDAMLPDDHESGLPFVESEGDSMIVYRCPDDPKSGCEFFGEIHEFKKSDEYPDCYFVLVCPKCECEFEIEG